MPPSTVHRGLFVTLVIGTIVATSLLISPSTTVGALESVASDPLVFGAVVAGLYLVRPLLAWPTTLLAFVVGYGFGVSLGIPIALVGVLVTVTPVYVATQWVVQSDSQSSLSLPFSLENPLERTDQIVSRYYETAGPIRGVTASRLAPIPSDIATCAAATSGVSLRHLLIGTAIGELPWTVAAVVVGASAGTVTTDGVGEVGSVVVVACVLGAALLLAGPTYRLVRDHERSGDVHSN